MTVMGSKILFKSGSGVPGQLMLVMIDTKSVLVYLFMDTCRCRWLMTMLVMMIMFMIMMAMMMIIMMIVMMINAKAVLVYMDTYTCSSLHTTKRQLEALATANRYFFEECKCNDSKDILRIIDQKKYFWQILSTKNVCKLLFQCDQQICSISTDELITSNQISSNHISWQIWSQISTSYLPKPCHKQRWSAGHSWSSSHKAGSHRDPCCPLAAPWWTPITWWWWWWCFQDMCICISVTFHLNLCFNIVSYHLSVLFESYLPPDPPRLFKFYLFIFV